MRLLLVPQLDRYPWAVSLAQRAEGKVLILIVFSFLLFLHGFPEWWLVGLTLPFFSFLPQHRWKVLFVATWSYLLLGYNDFHWGKISELLNNAGISWNISTTSEGLPLVLTAILGGSLFVWLAGHSPFARRLKRPVLILVSLYLCLMVVASYLPWFPALRACLWAFLVIFGHYLWFVCYSLKECKAPRPHPYFLQLGQYLPFWYPAKIPYPKGSAYLKRIEAKNSEQFAITQLKGLKLLFWALWLSLFALIINVAVFGYDELFFGRIQFKRDLAGLQIFLDGSLWVDLLNLRLEGALPRYERAFKMAALGTPLPWHINWAVLVIQFLYDILHVALTTHVIIAIIRMCGFNALRNTYKPLAASTIAEFWNRYFYYFKELLVEFFFYPVFFRYFKKRPKLRMYAATMAAAFFGNFLFHYLRDVWFIVELGFFRALGAFHVYFVYSFLLGNVIFLSQWRQERVKHVEVGPVSRFFAPVRVLGFYCLLTIFVDFRRGSISDNMAFLASLFNF